MARKAANALLALALLLGLPLLAQSGGQYDLTWNTVDGGGAMASSGEGLILSGTIGQPDAGLLAGSTYTLGGGFWGGGELTVGQHKAYLPLVSNE
jgi:hypothetical protein